jgi:hypothetical protein
VARLRLDRVHAATSLKDLGDDSGSSSRKIGGR